MIKGHRISTARQLRALASPERLEVFHALHGREPLSVREIGELLGRLPVSLYYHLRALEGAGLVVRTGRRAAARGEETLYSLPAEEFVVEPASRGRAEVAALRRIAAGIFRRAKRLHDALVAEQPARQRSRREHLLVHRTIKLDAAGLRRVNALLLELTEVLQRTPPVEDGAYYTVTLHLARDQARR
jgi:DNA-binding transcriptional ArsR family regulator